MRLLAAAVFILLVASTWSRKCVFIVTDPQEEFLSNRGILRHPNADVIAEGLVHHIVKRLSDGCRVVITAAFIPPQDCSFLTQRHVTNEDIVSFFLDRSLPHMHYQQFKNKDKVATTDAPPKVLTQAEIDDLLIQQLRDDRQSHLSFALHPTILLRLPYLRTEYFQCDKFTKCGLANVGSTSSDCALEGDEKDGGVVSDCGDSHVTLFPPNRVMAPNGGAAMSAAFLKLLSMELDRQRIVPEIKQNLYFLLRGFGAPGVRVYSSLFNQGGANTGQESRCMFSLQTLMDQDICSDKLNLPEFKNLLRKSADNWRERTFPPIDEIDVTHPGEMCTPPNFYDGMTHRVKTEQSKLTDTKWPTYSPHMKYVHLCPLDGFTQPALTHPICRIPDTGQLTDKLHGVNPILEFDQYISPDTDPALDASEHPLDDCLAEQLCVELAGFGLDTTILETAVSIQKAYPKSSSVRVLGHLSVPMLPGHRQNPPEGSEAILPKKLSSEFIAQYLAMHGVTLEHEDTFVFGEASMRGWITPDIEKLLVPKPQLPSEYDTVSSLVVLDWSLLGSLLTPFDYILDESPSFSVVVATIKAQLGDIRINSLGNVDDILTAFRSGLKTCNIAGADTYNDPELLDASKNLGDILDLMTLTSGDYVTPIRLMDRMVFSGTSELAYRPSPMTCRKAVEWSEGAWLTNWNSFVFSTPVQLFGLAAPSPCHALLQHNIDVATGSDPGPATARQLLITLLTDLAAFHALGTSDAWIEARNDACEILGKSNVAKRAEHMLLTAPHDKSRVILLQDVGRGTLLELAGSADLAHNFHIAYATDANSLMPLSVVLFSTVWFYENPEDHSSQLMAVVQGMGHASAFLLHSRTRQLFLVASVRIESPTDTQLSQVFSTFVAIQQSIRSNPIAILGLDVPFRKDTDVAALAVVSGMIPAAKPNTATTTKVTSFPLLTPQVEMLGLQENIFFLQSQMSASAGDLIVDSGTGSFDPAGLLTKEFPFSNALLQATLRVNPKH